MFWPPGAGLAQSLKRRTAHDDSRARNMVPRAQASEATDPSLKIPRSSATIAAICRGLGVICELANDSEASASCKRTLHVASAVRCSVLHMHVCKRTNTRRLSCQEIKTRFPSGHQAQPSSSVNLMLPTCSGAGSIRPSQPRYGSFRLCNRACFSSPFLNERHRSARTSQRIVRSITLWRLTNASV